MPSESGSGRKRAAAMDLSTVTEEELSAMPLSEQKRVRRLIRNRLSAQLHRDRQRQYVERLVKHAVAMRAERDMLRSILASLPAEALERASVKALPGAAERVAPAPERPRAGRPGSKASQEVSVEDEDLYARLRHSLLAHSTSLAAPAPATPASHEPSPKRPRKSARSTKPNPKKTHTPQHLAQPTASHLPVEWGGEETRKDPERDGEGVGAGVGVVEFAETAEGAAAATTTLTPTSASPTSSPPSSASALPSTALSTASFSPAVREQDALDAEHVSPDMEHMSPSSQSTTDRVSTASPIEEFGDDSLSTSMDQHSSLLAAAAAKALPSPFPSVIVPFSSPPPPPSSALHEESEGGHEMKLGSDESLGLGLGFEEEDSNLLPPHLAHPSPQVDPILSPELPPVLGSKRGRQEISSLVL